VSGLWRARADRVGRGDSLRRPSSYAERTILVVPNNTGKCDDDPAVRDRAARQTVDRSRPWADRHGVALHVPAFPRPRTDWRIYTHALDRDALPRATFKLYPGVGHRVTDEMAADIQAFLARHLRD
jgi:hypothetical protein